MDADGGDDDDQGMFVFWWGGEKELVNLQWSEKMGGIANKYKYLNGLYTSEFIF